MKKNKIFLLFVLTLLFSSNIIFAQDKDFGIIKPELDPDGFRNVKWGANKLEFTELVPNYEEGDSMLVAGLGAGEQSIFECYQEKSEDLTWEQVKFEKIIYCFFQNKLYDISTTTADFENAEKLRDLLKTKYGEGLQTIGVPQGERFIYYWRGPKTFIMLSCENNVMPYSGRGKLFMQSVEIENAIDEYFKQHKE